MYVVKRTPTHKETNRVLEVLFIVDSYVEPFLNILINLLCYLKSVVAHLSQLIKVCYVAVLDVEEGDSRCT